MFKKKIAVAVMVGAGLITGAGIAGAITEIRDGGEWDHGVSGGQVWSNYLHNTVSHGASVSGHTFADSGCKPPTDWARAHAQTKFIGVNGAYYRFC